MRHSLIDCLEPRRLLSAGELDRSYGTNGVAQSASTLEVSHRNTADALVLADGRTIVAASVTGPKTDIDQFFELTHFTSGPTSINLFPLGDVIEITRFTTDGSLDTTFARDGVLRIAYSPAGAGGRGTTPAAIALDADGRLLVAGNTADSLFVARFDAAGAPDRSFNGAGVGSLSIPNRIVSAGAMALRADGAIVVGGMVADAVSPTQADALVLRITPEGAFDGSFDGDGRIVTSFGFGAADINAVTFDADGNIVVAGQATIGDYGSNINRALVARLQDDGTLDRTFGHGGIIIDTSSSPATRFGDVLIQPDGAIVALSGRDADTTRSDGPVAIYRYTDDGAPDVTFGDVGVQSLSFKLDTAQSMVRQSDGKIVIGGDSSGAGLLRLNTDGSRDDTFGFSGFADGLGVRGSPQIALAPDGSIVVAGLAPSNLSQGVARVFGDPAPAALVRALSLRAMRTGPYKFTIDYRDSDGVDADTLDSADVRIFNGTGASFRARFVAAAGADGAGRIVATYKLAPVGGAWDRSDNGVYRIVLASNRVFDVAGNGSRGRTLGTFRIRLPILTTAAPRSIAPLLALDRVIEGVI